MSFAKHILTTAAFLALLLAAYGALFRYQFGAPMSAEYWVDDVMEMKQTLASRQASPRMLLVGGSAGLWGFDSALLEEATGIPVTNLSLHAGLRFKTHAENAKQVLREGDRLLLQIEYGFFNRDTLDKPNEWLTNQAMTWFPEYYEELSLYQKVRFISSVTPGRVLAGALAKMKREAVYEHFPKRRGERIDLHFDDGSTVVLENGHDSPHTRNIDPRGDLAVLEDKSDLPDEIRYAISRLRKRNALPNSIRDLLADCRRRKIPVFFVFPPTMKVSTSDFDDPENRAGIDRVRELLEREGVAVLGDAESSQYPSDRFLNTTYHLNRRGREEHSKRVAELLRGALEGVK